MVIQRTKTLFSLAIPIMIGMASQSLLYLIDTAMLGYLGSEALAAVAISEFTALLVFGLVTGIAHGVQACVSQYKGNGNEHQMARPLNEGLVLSIIIGLVVGVGLATLASGIFAFQTMDENVRTLGTPYLQIQLLAMAFVGMNFSFRSYYNGIGRPGIAVVVQFTMVAINILCNYVLIFGHFGFEPMGVTGAGLGTAIAIACGTLLYFVISLHLATDKGFLRQLPSIHRLRKLFTLSLPMCLQTVFLYAGVIALIWIIGRIGTDELAAANVIMKLTMVIILPSFAMGAATLTLVGKACGRSDHRDAKRWGWHVTTASMVVIGLLGLPLLIAPEWVLAFFIHDQQTLEIALLPTRLAGLTMGLEGAQFVLMHALIGAGDTRSPMWVSSLTQWLIFLPLCYLLAIVFGFGLVGVWLMIAFNRPLIVLIYAYIWRRGLWAQTVLSVEK